MDEWTTKSAFATPCVQGTFLGVDGSRTLAMEAGGPRATFAAWALHPLPVLAPWALGSLAIGLTLLGSALLVALVAGPGSEGYVPVFADPSGSGAADVARIAFKNTMVLSMQVLVCVAVYLVNRPGRYSPAVRWLVLRTVAGFVAYSLLSQAWRLGHDLASAAETLGFSPAELLARACVHAIPELTAVFLPLASCLMLVRRGRTEDLGAAAVLCAVVAWPVVFFCAGVEVHLTPFVV